MVWLGSLLESWRDETWVAAQSAAEISARIEPSSGGAELGSVKQLQMPSGLKALVLGCAIRTTPDEADNDGAPAPVRDMLFSTGIEMTATKIDEDEADADRVGTAPASSPGRSRAS